MSRQEHELSVQISMMSEHEVLFFLSVLDVSEGARTHRADNCDALTVMSEREV
jgi:hypothetical protein